MRGHWPAIFQAVEWANQGLISGGPDGSQLDPMSVWLRRLDKIRHMKAIGICLASKVELSDDPGSRGQ